MRWSMYAWNGQLVIVQNAFPPKRVMRLTMSADGHRIERAKAVDAAQPAFELPTRGAVAGDRLLLIANSQKGKYDGEGSDNHAAFDLEATFSGCAEATGTLDGSLKWVSVAETGSFKASMNGQLDWSDANGSASCALSLELEVTQTSVHYKGSMCGYDVGELSLGAQ